MSKQRVIRRFFTALVVLGTRRRDYCGRSRGQPLKLAYSAGAPERSSTHWLGRHSPTEPPSYCIYDLCGAHKQ